MGELAKTKFTHIDLFSGIGGFSVALHDICETRAYCDINPTSNLVLEKNMKAGLISQAPIQTDVRTFHYDKKVDIVTLGSPCCGFSFAGKRKGFANKHSNLFFKAVDFIKLKRPKYVLIENTVGITKELPQMCELFCKDMNYSLFWTCTRAHALIGAPHDRYRWFAVAVADEVALDIPYIQPKPHDFKTEPCDRTTNKMIKKESQARTGMLGNSVMPLMVQLALNELNYAGKILFEDLNNIKANNLTLFKKPLLTSKNMPLAHQNQLRKNGKMAAVFQYQKTQA